MPRPGRSVEHPLPIRASFAGLPLPLTNHTRTPPYYAHLWIRPHGGRYGRLSGAAPPAVKHGRRALGELKLGLLSGAFDQGTPLRLKSVAADLKDGSGDERLDQVLAEIDLPVAAELAKAGVTLISLVLQSLT
jgi:Class II flagellar assembly regulator